jgi:chemosensory pili system protein ChpA (sensor histidine kinase/response regulator)
MSSNSVESGDNESVGSDLGPLAWVLDELRKSLDGATKALRRLCAMQSWHAVRICLN